MKRLFDMIKKAFIQTVKDQYPKKVIAIRKMQASDIDTDVIVAMIDNDKDLSRFAKWQLKMYIKHVENDSD